jgi:uncharacterized membrane protein
MEQTRSMTTSTVIPVIGLILGVALALIANYTLDHLADTSDTWHQIQHGTFFVGGVLVGYAVTMLYRLARSRA